MGECDPPPSPRPSLSLLPGSPYPTNIEDKKTLTGEEVAGERTTTSYPQVFSIKFNFIVLVLLLTLKYMFGKQMFAAIICHS